MNNPTMSSGVLDIIEFKRRLKTQRIMSIPIIDEVSIRGANFELITPTMEFINDTIE